MPEEKLESCPQCRSTSVAICKLEPKYVEFPKNEHAHVLDGWNAFCTNCHYTATNGFWAKTREKAIAQWQEKAKKVKRSAAKCIICEKEQEVKNGTIEETWQMPTGLAFRGGGNYGSKYFDGMMSRTELEFIICDDCVKKKQHLMREVHRRTDRHTDVVQEPFQIGKREPQVEDDYIDTGETHGKKDIPIVRERTEYDDRTPSYQRKKPS